MLELTFKFKESILGGGKFVAWAEVESRSMPSRATPWFIVAHGEKWEALTHNLRILVQARSRELDLNPDPICIRLEESPNLPADLWALPGARSEGIIDGLSMALNPRGRAQMDKRDGTVAIRWGQKMLLVPEPEGALYPEEIALILEWALRSIPEGGVPGLNPDETTRRNIIWTILAETER